MTHFTGVFLFKYFLISIEQASGHYQNMITV